MPDSNSYLDSGDGPDWLSSGAVAKAFNVTPTTVRTWELKGRLVAIRTPGGQRRFRRADVEALMSSATPDTAATA